MKTKFVIIPLVSLLIAFTNLKAQETRYYDLVLDSLEIPGLAQDTTIGMWVEVDLWMDGTRRIYYKNYIYLGRKPVTLAIGSRAYDVPRGQVMSSKIEIGVPYSDYDIYPYTTPYLLFEDAVVATSRGRQSLFTEQKSNLGKLFPNRNVALKIYWHLEASKLQ